MTRVRHGDGTLKGRLTDEERSDLIAHAGSLVPKENIFSLCAFGPKVAGYQGEGSAHDLIIITKDFEKKTPGMLGTESIKPSPIVIDEAVLLNAAERPALDEAVIGLFLNIYEPLVNADFLRKVEMAYKKRTMAEKLIEIQADYGDLSSNLIIPYEFFLFDRLHQRAIEYSEEIDGYVQTYDSVQGVQNTEFALRGFRESADQLASLGIIEKADDSVRLPRGRKQRKRSLHRLFKMYPFSAGGASKYAIRSSISITGIERGAKPLIKLKSAEKGRSLIQLDRPNKLLRLEEGTVFDDASRTVEEVAQIYGFSGAYSHEEEKKGGLINSSTQLRISADGREVKLILKHFPELKNAKWVLLNIWAFTAKRFNMTPLSRLNREVEAVRRLHQLKIKTHRITGVILDERTLVTEYTEGDPLDKCVVEITSGKSTDTIDIEEYAKVLGKMHKSGLVYGDTKPANALVGQDGIYLIDLEQAVERGDQAWDLAEFLYYSAKLAKQEEGMRLVARSFLNAYGSENGWNNIVRARSIRYLMPFLMVMTPKMRRVVREELARHSTDAIIVS
jgi:tRNA A-37 threonylcarbamoyl transferase component Bud32